MEREKNMRSWGKVFVINTALWICCQAIYCSKHKSDTERNWGGDRNSLCRDKEAKQADLDQKSLRAKKQEGGGAAVGKSYLSELWI